MRNCLRIGPEAAHRSCRCCGLQFPAETATGYRSVCRLAGRNPFAAVHGPYEISARPADVQGRSPPARLLHPGGREGALPATAAPLIGERAQGPGASNGGGDERAAAKGAIRSSAPREADRTAGSSTRLAPTRPTKRVRQTEQPLFAAFIYPLASQLSSRQPRKKTRTDVAQPVAFFGSACARGCEHRTRARGWTKATSPPHAPEMHYFPAQ
jgi:hypothetical protein